MLGCLVVGFGSAVSMPLLLRGCGLRLASPLARGLAVGSAAHVSGVAALAAAGEAAAADAASVATVIVAVSRVSLVHVPWVGDALGRLCGQNVGMAQRSDP